MKLMKVLINTKTNRAQITNHKTSLYSSTKIYKKTYKISATLFQQLEKLLTWQ